MGQYPFKGHKHVSRPDGSMEDAWTNYQCGHCGQQVSGAIIAFYPDLSANRWLLCPSCAKGSVQCHGNLYPSPMPGNNLKGLPSEVDATYNEARRCMSVNAFTACELLCRKILMHVAVDKGADEGKAFEFYLNFMETSGYITPAMKGWVDLIRTHGNQATHKIAPPDKQRAESTFTFTATLLRIVYEMEHLANRFVPTTTKTP